MSVERELRVERTKNQWAELASDVEDGRAWSQRPYTLILYLKNEQMMLMIIISLTVRG